MHGTSDLMEEIDFIIANDSRKKLNCRGRKLLKGKN